MAPEAHQNPATFRGDAAQRILKLRSAVTPVRSESIAREALAVDPRVGYRWIGGSVLPPLMTDPSGLR